MQLGASLSLPFHFSVYHTSFPWCLSLLLSETGVVRLFEQRFVTKEPSKCMVFSSYNPRRAVRLLSFM